MKFIHLEGVFLNEHIKKIQGKGNIWSQKFCNYLNCLQTNTKRHILSKFSLSPPLG